MTDSLILYSPGTDFVLPYIKAELSGVTILPPEADRHADLAVMLSSCDIYGDGTMENCDEESPLSFDSPWLAMEEDFAAGCRRTGTPYVILRCADIIGTGMTGFTRSLANDIWRGTFFHLPGNVARRSVVHATDIARIVHALAHGGLPSSGLNVFNVSDGTAPSIHDLAEALAYRMCNKRISTLSTRPQQVIGRFLYGKKKVAAYTTTRTFSAARLVRELAFKAVPACEYLRTHIYDDNSL